MSWFEQMTNIQMGKNREKLSHNFHFFFLLAKWFLRKRVSNLFSIYSYLRDWPFDPPLLANPNPTPPPTPRLMISTNSHSTWKFFHTNFSFYGKMVLKCLKKVFENTCTNKFSIIPNYLPLKEGLVSFHFNKFESTSKYNVLC